MQHSTISERSPPWPDHPLPSHIESTPNFEGDNL